MKNITRNSFIISVCLTSAFAFACEESLVKFPFECDLSDRYQEVKEQLFTHYNVNVEETASYRAVRLINNSEWKKSRTHDFMPWKVYKPAPDTWLMWEKGASIVKSMANAQNYIPLTIENIEELNKSLISKKMMSGLSKIKGNRPGKIRSGILQAPPGAKFSCKKNPLSQKAYEIFKDYDLKDYQGDPLIRNHLSKCSNKSRMYGGSIWYMKSNRVEKELRRWIDYFNTNASTYINGQNIENDSPIEFLAKAERWFIAIHPFGDGNGRTSRFIQDYFLEKMKLPYVPEGRLSRTFKAKEYVEHVKSEMEKSVKYLESCLEQYKKREQDIKFRITGHCLPLYERSDSGESNIKQQERIAFKVLLDEYLKDE